MVKNRRSGKKTIKSHEGDSRIGGTKKKTVHKRKRKKDIAASIRAIRDISVYGLEPSKKSQLDAGRKVKKSFSMEKELFEKLRNYASREKVTITEAFNRLLNKGLQKKKRKK